MFPEHLLWVKLCAEGTEMSDLSLPLRISGKGGNMQVNSWWQLSGLSVTVEKNGGALLIEWHLDQTRGPGKASGGGDMAWDHRGWPDDCIIGSDTRAVYIFLQVVSDHGDKTKAKPCCNQETTPIWKRKSPWWIPAFSKRLLRAHMGPLCKWEFEKGSLQQPQYWSLSPPAPSVLWWEKHSPNTVGRAPRGVRLLVLCFPSSFIHTHWCLPLSWWWRRGHVTNLQPPSQPKIKRGWHSGPWIWEYWATDFCSEPTQFLPQGTYRSSNFQLISVLKLCSEAAVKLAVSLLRKQQPLLSLRTTGRLALELMTWAVCRSRGGFYLYLHRNISGKESNQTTAHCLYLFVCLLYFKWTWAEDLGIPSDLLLLLLIIITAVTNYWTLIMC